MARVREALSKPTPQPFPNVDANANFYVRSDEALDVQFAENLTLAGGQFIFCEDHKEFIRNLILLTEERQWENIFVWDNKLQELVLKYQYKKARIGRSLEKADAGLTLCEALIARTGSILMSSKQAAGRGLSLFPPIHLVLAYPSQIVPGIQDGLKFLKTKYEDKLPSMITLATGPSRTADIEKTLVTGAHGPKEVFVFLVDNPA